MEIDIIYDDNGNVIRTCYRDENNKIQGKYKYFNSDGTIHMIANYKDSRFQGLYYTTKEKLVRYYL